MIRDSYGPHCINSLSWRTPSSRGDQYINHTAAAVLASLKLLREHCEPRAFGGGEETICKCTAAAVFAVPSELLRQQTKIRSQHQLTEYLVLPAEA